MSLLLQMLFCNKCITSFVHCCVKVERQAGAWLCSPTAVHQQDWGWAAQEVAGAQAAGRSILNRVLCQRELPMPWMLQKSTAPQEQPEPGTAGGCSSSTPARHSSHWGNPQPKVAKARSCLTDTGCSNSSVSGGRGQPCLHYRCEVCETRSFPPIPDSSVLVCAYGHPPNVGNELCH